MSKLDSTVSADPKNTTYIAVKQPLYKVHTSLHKEPINKLLRTKTIISTGTKKLFTMGFECVCGDVAP